MEIFLLGGVILGGIFGGVIGYLARKPKQSDTTELDSKITELKTKNEFIQNQYNGLIAEKKTLNDEKEELQIQNAELKTDIKNMQQTMADWEKTKTQFMEHAKTASLSATQELLKQNKDARKEDTETFEKKVNETTTDLNKKYETVTNTLHRVDEQGKEQQDTINTIEKVLSNPLEVGSQYEVSLENTLQAFSLQSGIDYHMQHSTDGGKNRPDAVILLPNNSALVIDAKASKFIWELAHAEQQQDTNAIATAYANLKNSMRNHLKDLTSKGYRDSLLKELHKENPHILIENISLCMWVGSDVNIGKIDNADNQFLKDASEQGVSVVAKSGLYALISLASRKIQLQQQIDNNRIIIKELQDLLSRIATLSTYGTKVTKGLKSANEGWNSFVNSFDRRILPSTKKIENLGVKPTKSTIKPLDADKNTDILDIPATQTESITDQSES